MLGRDGFGVDLVDRVAIRVACVVLNDVGYPFEGLSIPWHSEGRCTDTGVQGVHRANGPSMCDWADWGAKQARTPAQHHTMEKSMSSATAEHPWSKPEAVQRGGRQRGRLLSHYPTQDSTRGQATPSSPRAMLLNMHSFPPCAHIPAGFGEPTNKQDETRWERICTNIPEVSSFGEMQFGDGCSIVLSMLFVV